MRNLLIIAVWACVGCGSPKSELVTCYKKLNKETQETIEYQRLAIDYGKLTNINQAMMLMLSDVRFRYATDSEKQAFYKLQDSANALVDKIKKSRK